VLATFQRILAAVLLTASCALAADETPAHKALAQFKRGANFGNYLEAPKGVSWGARYDLSDLDNLKKEGFDHVRLPIAWHHYSGGAPEFKIEAELFGKVDFLVTNAVARGLGMIVNIHHFDEFTSAPEAQKEKFFALWKQIAEHYRAQPNLVAFELLNEPKDAATTEAVNPIFAQAISAIRQSNPNRPIFVGPGRFNSLDEVEKLKLPENDRNLIVTVHCYDPFLFTHQGASWTMPDTATTGIVYPGPPPSPRNPNLSVTNKAWVLKWIENYNRLPAEENPSSPNAFVARMEKVAKWSKENNRPIHLGEFGAYIKADQESRVRYYRDMRKTAERLGFGWAVWDWKAGFKYWDVTKPGDGMREALFSRE
jgi:endoglucanase